LGFCDIAGVKNLPAQFEGVNIRRVCDHKTETWFFSVVDIVQVLTQQASHQGARNYWKVLRNRLKKEGSQSVTNCNRLKLEAEDGKMRETDVANVETILRLIQSIPSPKAEPIKLWLAKVGNERIQEIGDPSRALDRARETWQKLGRRPKRRNHRQESPPRIGRKNRPKSRHRSKLFAQSRAKENQVMPFTNQNHT